MSQERQSLSINKAVSQNENSNCCDEIMTWPAVHEKVIEIVRNIMHTGGSVLDIGCGTGVLADRIADLGLSVYACDREKCQPRKGVEFIHWDIDSGAMPQELSNRNFDIIICTDVIEHLANHRNFLTKAAQLLKPCGDLLISTPNIWSISSRWKFLRSGILVLFTPEQYRIIGHINPVYPPIFHELIADTGFEIVSVCGMARFTPGGLYRRLINKAIGTLLFTIIRKPVIPGARIGAILFYHLRKKT